ncbi:LOW QUALITY PROTEIN: zinc finger protein 740 [Callospermophilus lateralis]
MAQEHLLACEGLAGMSLVPTAASKMMMLSQTASKQAKNGEQAGSPGVLRCLSQGHRKDNDKSRSCKDEDSLAEASHSKHKKVVVVEQDGSFQVKIPQNFIYEHCFAAFRSSYHLKRHILIHTGEKPFECDLCDISIQKYHLEHHKCVHSGKKPYQYERCRQCFSQTDDLLRHKRICGCQKTSDGQFSLWAQGILGGGSDQKNLQKSAYPLV